jgi:Xaa-Pro aminopeptidase
MRRATWTISIALICSSLLFGEGELRQRRQRAGREFSDGILLLHANPRLELTGDGFRQDPAFFYFTGLENTSGALLAIDGKSGESWLFLPSEQLRPMRALLPEAAPGAESEKKLGIEHVADWIELRSFLESRKAPRVYFAGESFAHPDLPANLTGAKSPVTPVWLQVIQQQWPGMELIEAQRRVYALMAVQDAGEIADLRKAGKATVQAIVAGMHATHPDVSQRAVEMAVVNACWEGGVHGVSFWPWAMAGENAVFPRPFASIGQYEHLERTMRAGELVRLDVGCEWNHYGGDLGRTIPVAGRYDSAQRETWNIFVAAYHVGVKALRTGVTNDQVFEKWSQELLRHQAEAKSALAQHAIESWSKRQNVPFWQIHTMNLVAGFPEEPMKAGTTIAFEPIASIDGQGFYLEDMFLLTQDGAELLTPGVPYTAEEIEKEMGRR